MRRSNAASLADGLGADLAVRDYADLSGWAADDHGAALATFRRSAVSLLRADPPLRPARPPVDALRPAAQAALEEAAGRDAKAFFERWFEPFEIVPLGGRGFLTGYFEPVVPGSLVPMEEYGAPLLARPDDLVTFAAGEVPPGLDRALQAGRRTDRGVEPYPDRAAIEDGGVGDHTRPVAYVSDAVAVFIIQVQGSARIRLPDGRTVRAVYAGRNGQPYTSIGRILVEEGQIPADEMSLERLTGWLRANPEEGRAVMRRNRSYVFFALEEERDPAEGPTGGAGIPLTAGRSLAVDRTRWSYGLPFWLEGELPRPDAQAEPFRRLMIAQDTGSAIVGPARGDVYMGSGPEAGTRAGLLRHPARFVVLLPRG